MQRRIAQNVSCIARAQKDMRMLCNKRCCRAVGISICHVCMARKGDMCGKRTRIRRKRSFAKRVHKVRMQRIKRRFTSHT